MSEDDRAELRKNIDNAIAALSERIRCLCSSRNTLAGINLLPPEVLSRVFLLVRDFAFERAPPARRILDWLQVTQVSQRWRQIAIDYSSLWTELSGCNEHLLQLFLSRSRVSPLSLFVHVYRQRTPLCPLVLQYLYRIQNLRILAKLGHWNYAVSDLCFPALELKELEISAEEAYHHNTLSWPPDLLGENAPQLRRLTIRSFPFLGHLPIFHGLTSFRLEEPIRRTPLSILLGALGQMPNLRSLTIKDRRDSAIPHNEVNVTNLPLPIIMHHLEDLTIHSFAFDKSLVLLNSLECPRSPTFEFVCRFYEPNLVLNSFPRLLQTLQRPYQNGMAPIYALQIGGSPGFNLVGMDTHRTVCHILLDCQARGGIPRDSMRNWIQHCHELPLTRVKSLELELERFDTSDVFKPFGDLQQLTIISLDNDQGGLIEFLLQNFDRHLDRIPEDEENEELRYVDLCSEGESWHDIAFPALEVIKLHRSSYDIRCHKFWVQALTARKRHGFGPRQIILAGACGIPAEMMGDIQNIVEVIQASSLGL
ncbi:hypothetical protein BDN72DRAFT_846855 [Pluteus cervinus]|uniref:Uncharacterized protein n=1 Tax=Pluteus cervinus TaxID=181527 RepID=A0ACD3AFE4_9AGAR|nr:hypothetical protein BDN72DRAFT_846855 [Pluteus cervinus]